MIDPTTNASVLLACSFVLTVSLLWLGWRILGHVIMETNIEGPKDYTSPLLFGDGKSSNTTNNHTTKAGDLSDDESTKLELVLQGPSTFRLALSMIDCKENKENIQEVSVWNYSSHTTAKIIETPVVVQVFQELAKLPRLEKLSISFNSPLPFQALTAFLRIQHQRREIQQYHPQRRLLAWWKKLWWFSSGDDTTLVADSDKKVAGLRQLNVSVVELSGSLHDRIEFCSIFQQFDSLQHLSISFTKSHAANNHEADDDDERERVALESERASQNETSLQHILQALKHHTSLIHLSLSSKVFCSPAWEEATHGNTETSITKHSNCICPVIPTLVSLAHDNQRLQSLKLHLWKWDSQSSSPNEIGGSEDDTWYIEPLAKTLSDPSLNESSQLKRLHFVSSSTSQRLLSSREEYNNMQSYFSALEIMVKSNFNITHVTVGWDIHEDDDDELVASLSPAEMSTDIMTCRPLPFYLILNRLGRKRLLCDHPCKTRRDWVEALIRCKEEPGMTFYWLSANPSIIMTPS